MTDLSIFEILPAAEYMRYSTDNQTENSIAYQQTKIRKFARENGIQIVASFQDEACSGTNTDRHGFQALVAAANQKKFSAVIIYDISRGSRDVGDWFTFRKAMMYLGIKVISASGQRLGDLTNSADFLNELITVGMGQVEVLNTRQKSIDGVAVKAKQGQFLGGVPPLGYDIVNGQYVINPAEARIVRQIFSWYAAGKSYDYIIDHLGGAIGKRGRPIGKNTLNGMLQNERYIGVYTWNKKKYKILRKWAGGIENPNVERIEGAIPPIIDNDTWERVQIRMKDNKRPGRNKARHQYLLTGLIECEECKAAYIGHASTNKKGGLFVQDFCKTVCQWVRATARFSASAASRTRCLPQAKAWETPPPQGQNLRLSGFLEFGATEPFHPPALLAGSSTTNAFGMVSDLAAWLAEKCIWIFVVHWDLLPWGSPTPRIFAHFLPCVGFSAVGGSLPYPRGENGTQGQRRA